MARRALVVRAGALGDVLLTRRLTYSLSLAGYRTTLVAPARFAPVVGTDPWIEAVLDSEGSALAPLFQGDLPPALLQADLMFDVAVAISNSRSIVAALSKVAPTVLSAEPRPQSGAHVAHQWAGIMASIAPPFLGDLPALPIVPPEGTTENDAPRICIHPGSGSPRKNWPLERFRELASRFASEGARVIWIQGPADADLGPGDSPVEIHRDRTLIDIARELRRADIYAGNDSGISHLAAACGTPSCVILGPTDPALWCPDGSAVAPVQAPMGRLEGLSVAAVWDAMTTLVAPDRWRR